MEATAKYEDEQNIREIESRIDIVELISETVKLSRKGNNYWGLCPFHQEKTPSFSVNRNKKMFYCFGCHAGGNIFSFIMKKDGLEFKEALELLGAKAGIEIIRPRDKKIFDYRQQIIAVNNAATQYYQGMLASYQGQEGSEYLVKRGITAETISTFRLGYASNEWNKVEEYLLKKGFAPELVKSSGLIKRSSEKQDRFYDLFRNRIIFPIFQNKQDIVGFGGRILGEGMPKYLNTAETELFSKRKNLYGLSQARESIRETNTAFLVEGYMDCIKLHQAGITNVVASLGTALTEDQAHLLRRYTEKVVVLYDGDEAGQRETLRAITVLRNADLKVEIVVLPPGKDPDEYIENYGKEEFWHYIQNNRCSDIEFKLKRYIYTSPELNLETKVKIINLLKEDILSIASVLEKEFYIKMLAQNLRVEENAVHKELSQSNRQQNVKNRNNIEILRDNYKYGIYGIQEKILAAMLKNDEIFNKIKQRIGINFFANPDYQVLATCYEQLKGDTAKKMIDMRHIASDEGLESTYARIAMLMEEPHPNEAREVEEFIMRVEQKLVQSRWQKAFDQIDILSNNGDFSKVLSFIIRLEDKYTNETREGVIR